MKRYLFGVMAILATVGIVAAAPAGQQETRHEYVSEWRPIDGHTFAIFCHGLPYRPLHVQVWIAVPIIPQQGVDGGAAVDFEVVRPWTDWFWPVPVSLVDREQIVVSNDGPGRVMVQVVAW